MSHSPLWLGWRPPSLAVFDWAILSRPLQGRILQLNKGAGTCLRAAEISKDDLCRAGVGRQIRLCMQSSGPTQAAGLRNVLCQLASFSRQSWGQNRWRSFLSAWKGRKLA